MLKQSDNAPTFRIMSQGIGRRYAQDNAETLRKNLGFTVNGQSVSLPKLYASVAGITSEQLAEKNQQLRKELASSMAAAGRSHPDLLSSVAYRNSLIKAKLELFGKRN